MHKLLFVLMVAAATTDLAPVYMFDLRTEESSKTATPFQSLDDCTSAAAAMAEKDKSVTPDKVFCIDISSVKSGGDPRGKHVDEWDQGL